MENGKWKMENGKWKMEYKKMEYYIMNYILESGYLFPICVFFWVFSIFYRKKIFTMVFSLCLVLLFYFFRDISYAIPRKGNQLHSPCEGTILAVSRANNLIHIAVFLSPFNVHLQYTPCQGQIIDQIYKQGEFNMAHLLEKSNYNERMETIISNNMFGKVKIVQIAGLLARSIVTFYTKGDTLEQNVPLGLIRLGSRVDIILNDNKKYHLTPLKPGDQIKIGDPLIKLN